MMSNALSKQKLILQLPIVSIPKLLRTRLCLYFSPAEPLVRLHSRSRSKSMIVERKLSLEPILSQLIAEQGPLHA
jgi:hypothetical protein